MHTRQRIREAVRDLLQDHDELRELFTARGRPVNERHTPYANIVSGAERSEMHSQQWQDKRTLPVYVRLYTQDGDESPNVLDDLAERVETLLSVDSTLGGIVESFEYRGADPDYESAAQQDLASLVLEYECVYIWEPTVDADDFETAVIEIDMAHPRNDPQDPAEPDGQIDASTTITLPQA